MGKKEKAKSENNNVMENPGEKLPSVKNTLARMRTPHNFHDVVKLLFGLVWLVMSW